MKLEAKNLACGAGGRRPRDLNFSLAAGEAIHLRGANGSGKSLLLKTLLGLRKMERGEVVNTFTHTRYLTQMQNRSAHLPFSLAEITGDSWKKCGLLEERHLGLAWNRASGGERQRALLSRFFSQPGELLVLDEPFNHLDTAAREKTRALLRETLANPTYAVLLVSHDDDPSVWLGRPVRSLTLGEAE